MNSNPKDIYDKYFPEMNDNMKKIFWDIAFSFQKLPEEQIEFIFGTDEDMDMQWVFGVACYITLEYIKYSFDHDDPEYPLSHFFNINDDSERMLQSRIMKYVLKYKNRHIENNNVILPPDHKFADTDMDSIEKKLKGYRITEMNFYEQQKVHDLEIIKAIVERRIVSTKKIPNPRFQEFFESYDELIESLIDRSKKSDEDMVFASLAFFTLEWHYSIETLYYLSCLMEDEGLKTVDQDNLLLICGEPEIESIFGGNYILDSRMVKERMVILSYLFGKDTNEWSRETMGELIKETLVLGAKYKEVITSVNGELYKEWFRKQSNMADWASFFRYYDIFAIWEKKEWTHKRIQNMRHLYDLILLPK